MPKQIDDEFSHIPNKQRRMLMRWVRDGKCRSCGGVRDRKNEDGTVSYTCIECFEKNRLYKLAHYVSKPRKFKPSKYEA
jgi:hypothetical protein